MRQLTNRIHRVKKAVDALPVRLDIEKPAFEHFRATGELPEVQALARAIVLRCKNGLGDVWGVMDRQAMFRFAVTHTPPRDDVLHRLYDEAVAGNEVVRLGARVVLRTLCKLGHDVTRPVFEDMGLEDVLACAGGVGLWLMGLPERLDEVELG